MLILSFCGIFAYFYLLFFVNTFSFQGNSEIHVPTHMILDRACLTLRAVLSTCILLITGSLACYGINNIDKSETALALHYTHTYMYFFPCVNKTKEVQGPWRSA